jgi:hypothetical protein
MNDVKTYARYARELLQSVADGIGKLESTAADRLPALLPASLPASLKRLPRAWGGGRGTAGVVGTVIVAGVAVSTAALIWSRLRGRDRRYAWSRRR